MTDTKRRRRTTLIVLGLLLVPVAAFLLRPQAVPAELALVVRAPLLVTLDEEGETRVRDRYVVSAPLAGRILRVELDPGDAVIAGETVLVTFAPVEPVLLDARSRAEAEAQVRAQEAALGEAQAMAEQAREEHRYAESELARYHRLAESGIVSDERLDSAELQVRTRAEALGAAEFAVRNARHALELARVRLLAAPGAGGSPPLMLRSPASGVVLRVLRESEAVMPAGEPLIEVGDPGKLEIVADFLSTDAVRMRPAMRVQIERWGGGGALAGRVRRVEPSGFTKISALGVEEQRVNVIVDLGEPASVWAALGDGYRVEVRVVVWEGEDVLQVPASALFRSEGDWSVFAVDGNRVRVRPVEVGERSDRAAQVLAGLEAGDRVIVHPSDSLADGTRIEPISSGQSGG